MTGRIMSRFAALPVFAVLATGFARLAPAADVYWTTDPQVADTAPPGSWDSSPPTALDSQHLKVWLGVPNSPDLTRKKFIHIHIKGNALTYFETATGNHPEGFMTNDTSTPVDVHDIPPIGGTTGNLLDLYWGFQVQPQWERLVLTRSNGSAVSDLQWDEYWVNSVCTNAEWSAPDVIDLLNASFDAPGAVLGNPHWIEVWLFPRIGTIGAFPPSLIAPPATGIWSVTTVFTDPDGNPHPGGGVKFTTSGAGLSVLDHFHAQVHVTGSGPGVYDLYAYNAMKAKYEQYRVHTGSLVPGAGRWTVIAAALGMLAVGALALRRRRPPRASECVTGP
jgi:hypothetical protein